MKAGLFDPYFDTLGGGERYMATVAECLLKNGWQVDLFWENKSIKRSLETRFGLDLVNLGFVQNIFRQAGNIFSKKQIMSKYDLIFYLSDGSVPLLFGQKNILHFQVPFTQKNGRSLKNKIKFRNIHKVICNSLFTKKFIDPEYGIKSEVIYPPVEYAEFQPLGKENIILSVSRFSQSLQAKKHEILIKAFGEIFKKTNNWKLVLAGGCKEEDQGYLKGLALLAEKLPVKFLPNIGYEDLKKLYGQAKIFWHAAGFGEDEVTHPEKMEHFGIVVVEAMAAGCSPVVIGKGGIPEIVDHNLNGFLWTRPDELGQYSLRLMESDQLRRKISKQAIIKSKNFSKDIFDEKILKLATTHH